MKNGILLFIGMMALTACQSRQTAPTTHFQKAKWETIAQINDLKRNKNHRVSIDVLAIKNEKMRMEVTATLGYQVASVLINREGFKAAVYPQKKFYQGNLSDRAFSDALNMPVSPRALFAIAFDEPITGQGWSCEKDAESMPKKCVQANSQIQVEWTKKNDGTKLVKITSPRIEMSWFFKNPELNFEEKPELFNLNVPNGYQVISTNVASRSISRDL